MLSFLSFRVQQSIAKDFAVELLTNDNSFGTLMIVKLLFYYNFTFDFWFRSVYKELHADRETGC